ncbi:MAG TPA: zinc-binding alcohol dehydrogenase [Armatimonadetes bacterium]|nr:zinc-binding alcohol dehydrogenase [Armatimonadota bacterium]
MKAKALVCSESQEFTLADVELPEMGPMDIVIRTRFSGVSIGTEFALIHNKISWGPYPLCTGYQGVGVVERVGRDVRGFAVGDKVYYRNSRGPFRMGAQAVSAVSGTHCSMVVTDATHATHGPALLPRGVDEEVASTFVMPAVGYSGVDMAGVRMGDVVAVQGTGLIGLGVVAAAKLRGAVVVAIDLDERKLAVARRLGADHLIQAGREEVGRALQAIAPQGADVVFEATGVPALLDSAFALCRPHGKFVFQGNYGVAPISFRFLVPHGKRITAYFPCDDGYAPCRSAIMHLLASGALKWGETITHRVTASDAPALYSHINRSSHSSDVLGTVIRWDDI